MKRHIPRAVPFLALLPFLIALVCAAGTAQPGNMSEPSVRPPLAFQQYAVNLREVAPQPIIEAHFDFTNRGEEPVHITELEASCGCLAPQLHNDQKTYRPGERGRFYVSVHTANEGPGPHSYTVNVKYQDSSPHE